MIELLRKTFTEWNKDKAPQLAAGIAYYTIFAIPPLLTIALALSGYFYNADAARNQVIAQLGGFIGTQTADFVQSLLENTNRSQNGLFASVISLFILLIGASGIFLHLQDALNTIWGITGKQDHRITEILKNRLRSFLMVLATGVLLLFFLLLSAVMSVMTGYFYTGAQDTLAPEVINFIVLFGMISLLFAMVYRAIPDKEITWRDVWLGAVVTALLFMLGKYAIGFYLSISNSGSTFGAAGSLIVLLIWIYYSAQIFLFGAEFTQVYAKKFGSYKEAAPDSTLISKKLPPASLHRE